MTRSGSSGELYVQCPGSFSEKGRGRVERGEGPLRWREKVAPAATSSNTGSHQAPAESRKGSPWGLGRE